MRLRGRVRSSVRASSWVAVRPLAPRTRTFTRRTNHPAPSARFRPTPAESGRPPRRGVCPLWVESGGSRQLAVFWLTSDSAHLASWHQAASRIPRISSSTRRNGASGAMYMVRYVPRKASQANDVNDIAANPVMPGEPPGRRKSGWLPAATVEFRQDRNNVVPGNLSRLPR